MVHILDIFELEGNPALLATSESLLSRRWDLCGDFAGDIFYLVFGAVSGVVDFGGVVALVVEVVAESAEACCCSGVEEGV